MAEILALWMFMYIEEVLDAVVPGPSTCASGGASMVNDPLMPHDSRNSADIILELPLAIFQHFLWG